MSTDVDAAREARYVIWPGPVISRTDGDRHFVGFGALVELYRIPPNAHVVDGTQRGFVPRADDINCVPRFDGDYPIFRG